MDDFQGIFNLLYLGIFSKWPFLCLDSVELANSSVAETPNEIVFDGAEEMMPSDVLGTGKLL